MKALVQDRDGPPLEVLRFADVPEPTLGPTDVLVDVEAVGINAADWHITTGEPRLARVALGLRRPTRRIPGSDVAGRVGAVGTAVSAFAPGDPVVGIVQGGALAERVAVPVERLVARPPDVDAVTAASIPLASTTALHAIRYVAQVSTGQRVLVTGASGGVGSAAVQLATAAGAHVTGVCRTENVDLVRSLGAAAVIDRTREPVPGDGPYDVIVHVAGHLRLRDLRRALTSTGTLVSVTGDGGPWGGPIPLMLAMRLGDLVTSQRLRTVVAPERAEDVRTLLDAHAEGALTPPIDRTYALAEGAAAIDHVWRGRTLGKVVVTV